MFISFKKKLINVGGVSKTSLPTSQLYCFFSMDWDSARKHCKDKNWQWSLDLINQTQQEMEELEKKVKKLEDQQKAQRLYNACNY